MIGRPIIFLSLLTALLFTACGPDTVYDQRYDITAEGWTYADSLSFAFPVTDTTGRYDLVLSIDHTTDFPYQNFYVRLTTHLPDGRTLDQPLSLQLADNFGEWYGDCSGEICSTDISIQEGVRFDATGEHRLVVAQYSRDNPLDEVTGVRFWMVKREE